MKKSKMTRDGSFVILPKRRDDKRTVPCHLLRCVGRRLLDCAKKRERIKGGEKRLLALNIEDC